LLFLYVAIVTSRCFKSRSGVAHVVMAIHCKRLFLMFHLFFRHMLQVCLSRCYICFTHTLQAFYLDVGYVFLCVSSVPFVSDVCCKCFHLDVSKIDLWRAHVAAASALP
jgi:hypothetical protein